MQPSEGPAAFVHAAWRIHRALYKPGGGRFLWMPANKRCWGPARLTTVGRRSGRKRNVIVGYIDDGPNLVRSDGWEGQPSWWLNLEAHPDAVVRHGRGGV